MTKPKIQQDGKCLYCSCISVTSEGSDLTLSHFRNLEVFIYDFFVRYKWYAFGQFIIFDRVLKNNVVIYGMNRLLITRPKPITLVCNTSTL
jgi:hypothetical protein